MSKKIWIGGSLNETMEVIVKLMLFMYRKWEVTGKLRKLFEFFLNCYCCIVRWNCRTNRNGERQKLKKKVKNRKTADIFYWKLFNSRNWWTKYLGRGGENWTEPKKKMEKIKFSQMVMEERWMRILTIHILGLGSAQWAPLQCQQINRLKSPLAQCS